MTFDESNAKITEQLAGKTIEYVVRNGKMLEFYTTDGHVVRLQADVKGDIHYRNTGVRIMLPPISADGTAGRLDWDVATIIQK